MGTVGLGILRVASVKLNATLSTLQLIVFRHPSVKIISCSFY